MKFVVMGVMLNYLCFVFCSYANLPSAQLGGPI